MNTRDYTNMYGNIKNFSLFDELEQMKNFEKDKPSYKIFTTKKGKKAITALKEIENNRNHSWYYELRKRAVNHENELALFYRGNKITFGEMFEKADDLATALANIGIQKGDEIPCCLSNTPELVYILLAANKLGAKLNLFSSGFDKSYLSDIVDSCSNKIIFITDNLYDEVKDILVDKNYQNKVMISLTDSLMEHPEYSDEYEPKLYKYYNFENKAKCYIELDSNLNSYENFVSNNKNENIEINDQNDLNTEFLITYTSGSTKIGHPKQIVHSNRSLIVSGRFHDSELSGNPEIKGLRGLSHIHADSNTNIITCISDNLMQLWSVALEPEYDKDKALDYIILNKPNYLNITTSFLIKIAKDYLYEKKYHEDGVGRKLPFLLATFAVGEGLSKGEEKLINKFLRESRAGSGVKIKGLSLPYTTVSVGGGDCEHGGIYYTLWKSMMEKLNYFRLKKREFGLMPEPFAQVTALKKNEHGDYEECNFNEYGTIVANSATTMIGYKNNKQATNDLVITDNKERDWISSNVYGYIDELGGVHVKGRLGNIITLSNGAVIPSFMIEDVICKDTKNILSCSVTQYVSEEKMYLIANVEFQPDNINEKIKILNAIKDRCRKLISSDLADELNFRIFDYYNSFPLTNSGKRSVANIENMKLEQVYSLNNDKLQLVQGNDIIKDEVSNNKILVKRS